jgi:hypothetical protein
MRTDVDGVVQAVTAVAPRGTTAAAEALLDAVARGLAEPRPDLRLLVDDTISGALVLEASCGSPPPAGPGAPVPPLAVASALGGASRRGQRVVRFAAGDVARRGALGRIVGAGVGDHVDLVVSRDTRRQRVAALVCAVTRDGTPPPAAAALDEVAQLLDRAALALRKAAWSDERSRLTAQMQRVHTAAAATALADFCVRGLPGTLFAVVLRHDPRRDVLGVVGVAAAPGGDRRVGRFVGYEAPVEQWAARALFGAADAGLLVVEAGSGGDALELRKFSFSLRERDVRDVVVLPVAGPGGTVSGALAVYRGADAPPLPEARSELEAVAAAGSDLLGGPGPGAARVTPFLYLAEVITASGFDLDRILDEVVGELRDFMTADAALVALVDVASGALLLERGAGYRHGALPGSLPLYEGGTPSSIAAHVVTTGEPYLAADTADCAFFYDAGEGVRSEVAAPLRIGERVFGVVVASHRRAGFFGPTDADRLQLFAGQVAWAIDDARLLQRARAQEERVVWRRQQVHFGSDRRMHSSGVTYHFGNLVGDPAGPMGEVYRRIERISHMADDHATVLVTGETGTGKELVAFAVHASSGRAAVTPT